MEYLTPFVNPDIIFKDRWAPKMYKRTVNAHVGAGRGTGSCIELDLKDEGYAFDEISAVLVPSLARWYCDRYKFPIFSDRLHPEYGFSYTPGLFKSLFSKTGVDLSYKGLAFPDAEAVVAAFKVRKSTKETVLKFCAKAMGHNGVILSLAALNKIPLLGPVSICMIPRPAPGKFTATYEGVVDLNKKMGIDVDLSLISDFEKHGLKCKYVGYRVSGRKVNPYVAIELSHKNEKESFKKTIEYLKSKGLANDSHYSEEGYKGFMHAKVAFSNKKPKMKAYFWIGCRTKYVKPQITIKDTSNPQR